MNNYNELEVKNSFRERLKTSIWVVALALLLALSHYFVFHFTSVKYFQLGVVYGVISSGAQTSTPVPTKYRIQLRSEERNEF